MTLALLFALLLIAEILGTIGGFGSSMLVMPLMSWFMPFDQALGLTATLHVFSNLAKIWFFRTGVSRRLLLWLGIPAIIGVVIGARATLYISGPGIVIAMSIVLVLLGIGLLSFPRFKFRASDGSAAFGGALSGLVAGLTGTGGAIRGVTLAAFDLEKLAFVSTSAWIDLGVDSSRAVIYAEQGYMRADILYYLPALLVVSVCGSWVGRWLLVRVPQRAFRILVLGLVIAMGMATLLQLYFKSGASA